MALPTKTLTAVLLAGGVALAAFGGFGGAGNSISRPPRNSPVASAPSPAAPDDRCAGRGPLHLIFDFKEKGNPFERERSYEVELFVDKERTLCHFVIPAKFEPGQFHLPPEASSCAFTLLHSGQPGGIVLGGRPSRVQVRIRSHGVAMFHGSVTPRYENPSEICIYSTKVVLSADTGGNVP